MAQRRQGLLGPAEHILIPCLDDATPADWIKVVRELSPFMKESRVLRLQAALRRRRSRLHLVLENIADPHNSAAVSAAAATTSRSSRHYGAFLSQPTPPAPSRQVLRTAEACGVQHVHVIESISEFLLPAATATAAARGTVGVVDGAAAASRWLTVHRYRSARECIDALDRLNLQV